MAKGNEERERGRFSRWYQRNLDDLFFRALIGPAQVSHAVHGCDAAAREHWKRDLEARKRYSREQRELRRSARAA